MEQTLPTPTYEALLAAKVRLIPLLAQRLPKPIVQAGFGALSVPVVRGKPTFKRREFVDVALDFTLHGMLRHGRNYAAQQLTAGWPADKTERAVLAGMGGAAYLFAKVESTTPGEGLSIIDAGGKSGFIRDARFSKSIQPGSGMAGFVFEAGGMLMVTGAPFLVNWEPLTKSLSPALRTGRVWTLGDTPDPERRAAQMDYAASFIATMFSM